jgi:hypothetical protein
MERALGGRMPLHLCLVLARGTLQLEVHSTQSRTFGLRDPQFILHFRRGLTLERPDGRCSLAAAKHIAQRRQHRYGGFFQSSVADSFGITRHKRLFFVWHRRHCQYDSG